MKKINSEKGQALILIAFGIVGLIALTALTIDGSRVYEDRRHAQNAADTAALAAALTLIEEGPGSTNYKGDGYARALANGYEQSGTTSTVVINLCSEVTGTDPCQLPSGADPAQYIRVRITSIVNTTFAKVVGRDQLTNVVEAITRVQGSAGSGSFFNGAGLVATKNTNTNQCFLLNGGANVTLHNTGVFVNCTGTEAFFANGNANMVMGGNANIAGCYKNQGGNISGEVINGETVGGALNCNQPQQSVGASTFANVPTAKPTPTCTQQGGQSGNTLTEGYFNSNMSFNSSVTLTPGTYCFNGGINLNGQSNISGTGKIKIVLGNNSLNINNDATFDDVEIYEQNGTLSIKGDFFANRLRFFATGTGGMDVNAQGSLTAANAYLYSYRGLITWNAQATMNLHAPPQDDPDKFGGLLIYQPWGNTSAFILNGGTNSNLTGTILVPTSDVTYNGGSGFQLHGQVIGQTFKVNGNANLELWFEASENYNPGGDPTIEFTW